MNFNIDDISEIIEKEIKNYDSHIVKSETGTVLKYADNIAIIYGLDKVKMGELLIFKNSVYGMVMNLEENIVGAVILNNDNSIKEGDDVSRTHKIIETPVGNGLIGRTVNAIGQPIDDKGPLKVNKYSKIEKNAKGIMKRKSISEPIETGILAIDSMIPIGKGQRELIIGDRQTGKTSIAIDTIINQKNKNVKCIYVSIGQKDSTVAQIVEKLKLNGAMEYTVIVNASASQSSPMQYLAPYTGVTIAEEWMENGEDVLIVYDDLSKHAVAYREMSLLLRRPPGREAYPGDVFYLHSRLLERAAKIINGGSITALPIIETQAGDISAYIPTNVISITDGQIFLSNDLFMNNIRPAINIGTSVSRVGSAAQYKAIKQVSNTLKLELAQYYELESFSKFGSDLDNITKEKLDHGLRIIQILIQKNNSSLSMHEEALLLFIIKSHLIKWIPIEEINSFKQRLLLHFKEDKDAKVLLKKLQHKKEFTDTLEISLKKEIGKFIHKFTKSIKNYNVSLYGELTNYNKLGK